MAGAAAPPAYTIQQLQPMVQPSVVLGTINPPPTAALQKRERRWSKALKVTGWLHVSLGIVTVIFGIVAIIIRAWSSYYATPIWMGLLFFVTTGILGVLASSRKKKGLIVGYMVMCILTTFVAFSLVIICIVLATYEDDERYYRDYGYYHSRVHVCNPGGYESVIYNCAHKVVGRQVLDSLMALAAFVEGIVTIVGASYSCYAMSCCTSKTPTTTTTTAYYTPTGQVTYPSGHPSGQVYVQVPQATYVVAQGPGNPASNPGVPMYIAQPAPPTGYGQAPPTGYGQAPPTGYGQAPPTGYAQAPPAGYTHAPPAGYPQAQGPVPQQYGVNMAQVPTGPPPPNVQYAPTSGPVQGSMDAPPMYQQQPTAPPDAYGTK